MRKSAKGKGLRIERNSRWGVEKKGSLQGHRVALLENFPLVTVYAVAESKPGAQGKAFPPLLGRSAPCL